MNRQLAFALVAAGVATGLLAGAPALAQRAISPAPPAPAPALQPAAPLSAPMPNLETKPVLTPALPQNPRLETSPVIQPPPARMRTTTSPVATASPTPGAESADIPNTGAGYDPCLHPTNPPDYCKQEPK